MNRRQAAAWTMFLVTPASPAIAENLPETVVRLEKEVRTLRKDVDTLNERLKAPVAADAGAAASIQIFVSKGNPFARDTDKIKVPPGCRFQLAKVTVDEKLVLDETTEIRRVQIPAGNPAIVSAVVVFVCGPAAAPTFCSSNDVIKVSNGQHYEVTVVPGIRLEDCQPVVKLRN